jgi:hypothetical protein
LLQAKSDEFGEPTIGCCVCHGLRASKVRRIFPQ